MAERHPIDFEALRKGDVIPAAKIEHITGVSRRSKEYNLGMLRLRDRIVSVLRRDFQRVWTIVIAGEELRILTDIEASSYNDYRAEQGYGTMRKAVHRMLAVDASGFDEDLGREHERRCLVRSRMVQAAGKSKKEALRLPPHERATPRLIADE